MDPIADLLIRIKNGYSARKDVVMVPHSKMKEQIAKILVEEGYLKNIKLKVESEKFKVIELSLKYKAKKSAVREVKIISKPGVRIYCQKGKVPRVRESQGITLISTSQGLMTDKKAQKSNLGGEVIAQVW